MTKEELRAALQRGAMMANLFDFAPGQGCEIYKAEAFEAGGRIIYIPDIWLNEIPAHCLKYDDEIQSVLDCCYTGDDFIRMCEKRYGDGSKAAELFAYVDWQHPSSTLDAGELDGVD